jgi:hypothetical protein
MARPKGSYSTKLDLEKIEIYASIGCTLEEIAVMCDCSERTLQRRATAAIAKGHERMKTSLRRWQYEKAKSGNTTMLIWLGKQFLGQRDKIDETVREETVIIEPINRNGTNA